MEVPTNDSLSLAAVAAVAVVAVGGLAIWRNQSQPSQAVGGVAPTAAPSASPTFSPTAAPTVAPSPSELPPATQGLTPGTRYQTTTFSQPMTFVLPSGLTASGGQAVGDPSDRRPHPSDLGPAPIGLSPSTTTSCSQGPVRRVVGPDRAAPDARGHRHLACFEHVHDAVSSQDLQVDGRTATTWDATFGKTCSGEADGAPVFMSAGDVHRFYAIPTAPTRSSRSHGTAALRPATSW